MYMWVVPGIGCSYPCSRERSGDLACSLGLSGLHGSFSNASVPVALARVRYLPHVGSAFPGGPRPHRLLWFTLWRVEIGRAVWENPGASPACSLVLQSHSFIVKCVG